MHDGASQRYNSTHEHHSLKMESANGRVNMIHGYRQVNRSTVGHIAMRLDAPVVRNTDASFGWRTVANAKMWLRSFKFSKFIWCPRKVICAK